VVVGSRSEERSPIRVLIAEDHTLLRKGLRLLLEGEPDMSVVGEAADAAATRQLVASIAADVLVLDFRLPGAVGTRLIAELAARGTRPRVLVLTLHDDPAYARAAVQAGAAAYVVKAASDVELVAAIRAVHSGRTFIDVATQGQEEAGVLAADPLSIEDPEAAQLGDRERQVLTLVARGHTSREIAERLGVSERVVERDRLHLARGLGLRERRDFVSYATRVGLLPLQPALAPAGRSKRR
jgi:DNA-binding NarL/FixJ family response regulator